MLLLSPTLGSANDDAGIRSVQMQDARERSLRQAPRASAQPTVTYAAPVQARRGGYEMFQPIVRSFAPQPRPARALPAPIQFGYGASTVETSADPFRAPKASLQSFSDAPVRRRVRLANEIQTAASATALQSNRSVCVRLCDGYHFPVGTLSSGADWATHAGLCQSACPAADVRLYSLAPGAMDMAQARSRDGQTYSALATAFAYRKGLDQSCSCQTGRQASYMSLLRDVTLRAGDTVIVGAKAKVFRGASQWPYRATDFADFRKAQELTKAQRRQIDSITAASLNVELLRPFSIAKVAGREDVAVVRPSTEPQAQGGIIRELGTDIVRPALRASHGFAPAAKIGSSIQVVNSKAPGFILR